MYELADRQILVTGASSGIGRCVAEQCAAAGATVVLTARDEKRLAETLGGLPGSAQHRSVPADLTQPEGLENIIKELVYPLHGVVYSAGISALSPIRQVSDQHIQSVMSTNFQAPLLLTRMLLQRQLLHDGASLVFLSSVATRRGVEGNGVYSASKAALAAASRCLAREVSKRRIRVNTISPGHVRTPMFEKGARAIGGLEHEASNYPLGFGLPIQIAGPVVFLLSEAASWITGTDLVVDGGYTIR